MNVLGIDYGSSKIGIAVGDQDAKIAFPRETMRVGSQDEALQKLKEFIEKNDIVKIAIGVPVGMKSQETDQTTEVRNFINMLTKETELEIHEVDERLTTQTAQLNFDKKQTKQEDSLAAQAILQLYFDMIQ